MANESARDKLPSTESFSGQVAAIRNRFLAAWEAGQPPQIEEYLGEETIEKGPARLRQLLVELVGVDLEWRWRTPPGETISSKQASESTGGQKAAELPGRPRLEDYARCYPALGPVEELPEGLIVTEYRARHRWGDKPAHAEYLERFAGRADALGPALTAADEALAAETTVPRPAASPDSRAERQLAAIPLDEFVTNLTESGLLAAEEVSEFQQTLPPEQQPGDGQTLAKRLVEAEKLTPYQAELVCRGETQMLAFGEYVVLDRIGAGGMGQVLKAKHRTMGRLVALKMIAPKLVDSPDSVKRFHREVRAAAKLEHPNIVTAYDASEHRGVHYLAMQYVEGQDLAQVLKARGPLPVEEAVDYVLQAARGLEYAHEQGIVHRDIKPGNLLLQSPLSPRGKGAGGDGAKSPLSTSGRGAGGEGARGTVKILDMGLARFDEGAQDNEPDLDRLTGSSQMMGTCDYMAPEQALDTHHADARADIYSLGCTLYRLLTGKRPYTGNTPMQVLLAHREAPIPSLCEARDDVPEELDAVFQKMVAKDPADRYQSMGTVIEALQSCVAPVEEVTETPSDAALASFLQDIAHGGSGTGLARAVDTGTIVESEPAEEPAASEPAKPAVPLRRRLMPYLAIGGPVVALLVLAGLLVLLVGPGEEPPSLGILLAEGPLAEVQIAAKHQDDDVYRPLELDAEGRVELKPGEYRLGLAQGHEKYRVVPDRITLEAGAEYAIRIEPKPPRPPLAIAPFSADEAKKHQQAWADYLGLPVEWENSIGMKFVLIPPGEFMMGSPEAERRQVLEDAKAANDNWATAMIPTESPQHRVKITKPLYLGKHEVTQAQWETVMGSNRSHFKNPTNPVEEVTWEDIQQLLAKLNRVGALGVRATKAASFAIEIKYALPTEAQWEYACRAGTTTAFSFGDDPAAFGEYAWFKGNSGNMAHPVSQKKPNAWGLYDMHGNVREWCEDWSKTDYYQQSSPTDPVGPLSGSERVDRGGSWGDWPRHSRSAYRDNHPPNERRYYLGFRLACEIPTDPTELKKFAAPVKEETPQPPATGSHGWTTLPNGWRIGQPVNLGPVANGVHWDYAPALSADVLTLLFASDCPGGQSDLDLWMSSRASPVDTFGKPVNLGPAVNSGAQTNGPSLTSDGLTIFFGSARSGGKGGMDLWMTTRPSPSDPFGPPVNLGPAVNSSGKDGVPMLSRDGLTFYFHSDRPGGEGEMDLWKARVESPGTKAEGEPKASAK